MAKAKTTTKAAKKAAPKTTSKSTAKASAKKTVKPAPKAVSKTTVKAAPKTKAKPAPKSTAKTSVKATPKTAVKKAPVKAPAKAVAKAPAKTAAKKPAKAAATKAPVKPAAKTKAPAKSSAKTQVKAAPKTTKPAPKATTKPVPKTTTKPAVTTPPKTQPKTQSKTQPKAAPKAPVKPATKKAAVFAVNEHVVYPIQGVGEIKVIEKRLFKDKQVLYYNIYFETPDMTVMVPVENAETIGLRKIVSSKEALKALDILKKEFEQTNTDWKTRNQQNLDLLKKGTISDIAQVVKTLYDRSTSKELPIQERKLFDNASKLLIDEISLALKKSKKESETMIFEKLEGNRKPVPEADPELDFDKDTDLE